MSTLQNQMYMCLFSSTLQWPLLFNNMSHAIFFLAIKEQYYLVTKVKLFVFASA